MARARPDRRPCARRFERRVDGDQTLARRAIGGNDADQRAARTWPHAHGALGNAFLHRDDRGQLVLQIIGIIAVAVGGVFGNGVHARLEGPDPAFVGADDRAALERTGSLLLGRGGADESGGRSGSGAKQSGDLAEVTTREATIDQILLGVFIE
jgi:hypothetical protein